MMPRKFRVALTGDFMAADGTPRYRDMGLSVFDDKDWIETFGFAEHRPEITHEQLQGANGVIVLTPAVTAQTVAHADSLLAVGRFGVGYDAVDVAACTEADVVVFITAGAVDYSVAEATVAWMLGLTHHIRVKDQLVRDGRWDERSRWMGTELRDRTFGAVGLGGIARAAVAMLTAFRMNRPIAFDPFVPPSAAEAMGVRLVGLDELMATADFVSVHCPLTDKTRGLIGARELGLMKPSAYLINTARGGIVDEDALFRALAERRIAGAALDVFAEEPVVRPHRFGQLDNVLLAPHSIAWTNELFRDIGRAACQGMVDLSLGRRPNGTLNPEVFERPSFQRKWERTRMAGTEPASTTHSKYQTMQLTPGPEIGERIKITDGPFTNFEGTVEAVIADRGLIRVTVLIFNRPTPVELEYWQFDRI
jgi:phosphoglycerate dehydrogenase-like enzyme